MTELLSKLVELQVANYDIVLDINPDPKKEAFHKKLGEFLDSLEDYLRNLSEF